MQRMRVFPDQPRIFSCSLTPVTKIGLTYETNIEEIQVHSFFDFLLGSPDKI